MGKGGVDFVVMPWCKELMCKCTLKARDPLEKNNMRRKASIHNCKPRARTTYTVITVIHLSSKTHILLIPIWGHAARQS